MPTEPKKDKPEGAGGSTEEDHTEAKDVDSVAESRCSVVRVVQNAADFKHEARFTTWVYTITRNLCIDQLRKRALRKHPRYTAWYHVPAGRCSGF